MKIKEQLHRSKSHLVGYDPACPECVQEGGLDGIIKHLRRCSLDNDKDWRTYADHGSSALASEQRRVIAILRLYRKVNKGAK